MRHLAPVAALLLGLSLASPAQAWDWRPPEGEAMMDLSAIDRLPARWGLIAVAGLRHAVADLPQDADLTALGHGLTQLDYFLFDTNREPLLASVRALKLDIALRLHGEGSMAHARALKRLDGPFGFEWDDHAAAEASRREALAIARAHGDDLDPHDLLPFLSQLAATLSRLGQHDEAVDLLAEIVAIWRASDASPVVLKPRVWALARELAAAGRDDEATAMFEEGLQLFAALERRTPRWATAMREYAAFQDAHDPGYARELRLELAQWLEASLGRMGGEHSLLPYTMADLGDVLARLGEVPRASDLHLRALALIREARGDENRSTWRFAHRTLAHLQRFDPENPMLDEVDALSARDSRRDEDLR